MAPMIDPRGRRGAAAGMTRMAVFLAGLLLLGGPMAGTAKGQPPGGATPRSPTRTPQADRNPFPPLQQEPGDIWAEVHGWTAGRRGDGAAAPAAPPPRPGRRPRPRPAGRPSAPAD